LQEGSQGVLMVWHTFMFIGLRHVGFFLLSHFCLVVSDACYSSKNICKLPCY
jgi:hypothetical protein